MSRITYHCDDWVVLQHAAGRIVCVGALGWSSNSSMAKGGQAEAAFGDTIAGTVLLLSECGDVRNKAHRDEGAKLLCNPFILEGPQCLVRGENQK